MLAFLCLPIIIIRKALTLSWLKFPSYLLLPTIPYSSLEAFLLLILTWYRSILADTTTLLRVLLRLHKVLRLLGFLFKIEENGGRRISLNSAKEPCRRHWRCAALVPTYLVIFIKTLWSIGLLATILFWDYTVKNVQMVLPFTMCTILKKAVQQLPWA